MSRRNQRRKSSTKAEAEDKSTNTPESKDSPKPEVDGIPSKSNDPEWYARDPRILDDAARIPFSYPLGKSFEQENVEASFGANHSLYIRNNDNYSIPGICTVKLSPSIGYAVDRLSPVNVAANALYTHVRYVNSGRKNYDPNDLMMYCLTFADIYSAVMWLQRIYAYAYDYSQRNWYIGGELLKANDINPDVIVRNLANFRYWLNTFINKVSAYAVPGDIYYFRRRAFLYANYYIENGDGNIRDQLYQFVPATFWKFDYVNNNNDGAIRTATLTQVGKHAVTNDSELYALMADIDHLLDNVDGDEDFGIMSGDILKAYGSNILGIAQIPEDYSILPIHDPYVLSQFKNATITWVSKSDDPNYGSHVYGDCFWNDKNYGDSSVHYWYKSGDVYQDPTKGIIKHAYTVIDDDTANAITDIKHLCGQLAMDKWISVENPEPGVGDVVEATRLTVGKGKRVNRINPDADGSSKWAGKCAVLYTGTEVVRDVITTVNQEGVGFTTTKLPTGVFNLNNFSDAIFRTTMIKMLDCFNVSFKYYPTVWFALFNPTDDAHPTLSWYMHGLRPFSNLDNTTPITSEILGRLHEAALLSLFFVPGVARLITG